MTLPNIEEYSVKITMASQNNPEREFATDFGGSGGMSELISDQRCIPGMDGSTLPKTPPVGKVQDSGVYESPDSATFRSQLEQLGNDPYSPSLLSGEKTAVSRDTLLQDRNISVGSCYDQRSTFHSAGMQAGDCDPLGSILPDSLSRTLRLGAQHSTFSAPPIPPRSSIAPVQSDVYNSRSPFMGHKKPVVMPDKFDGTGTWSDYLAHFEMCATINAWNEPQKANFLAVSLKGTAQMLLGDLPVGGLMDYSVLINELESRFGYAGQSELFRTQVKNRRKRPEESLAELGQDIKRLTARAYPEATPSMRDLLAKGHFSDALTDSEMRMHIYHSKPASLQDTVHLATEWQAFERAELQRTNPHDNGNRRPMRTAAVSEPVGTESDMMKQINDLKAELDRMKNGPQDGRNSNSKFPKKTYVDGKYPNDKRVCWNCSEEGHFRFQCPHEPKDSFQRSAMTNQGNQQ